MSRWIGVRLSSLQAPDAVNVRWDAEKKSLDVAQKGVNLTAFRGIKAL
jgi:hypothetical protein